MRLFLTTYVFCSMFFHMFAHIYTNANEARKIVGNYQTIHFYGVLHLCRKYQNTNTMCTHIALLGCSMHDKYDWSTLIMISNMQNRFQSNPPISSFAFKLQGADAGYTQYGVKTVAYESAHLVLTLLLTFLGCTAR